MSRVTIKNILANLVAFLILFNVLSFAVFLYYGDIMPILWWLMLPFFLMQVFRAKASNAYAFTLLHIIVLAACVWIAWGNWFAMGFIAVAVVYSFYIKGSGEWEPTRKTGVTTLVLHVGMFVFVQWLSGEVGLFQQQLAGVCITVLGFIIIYTHMDNIDLSLRMLQNPDDDRHSASQILRINNMLIIVFTAIVVLIGMFVSALPLGRALAAGWGAVRGVTSGFFARFSSERPAFDFPEYTPIRRVGVVEGDRFIFINPDSPMFLEEDELYVLFSEYLGVVAFINRLDSLLVRSLLVVAMIIIVYNFIRYFVNLSRRRNQTKHRNDEKNSLTRDILSDIRDLLPRFGRYSKNAIRRAYTKKVNWHIRHGVVVKKSDTTDIIADKIRNIENIDELTAMYEQVRYSG